MNLPTKYLALIILITCASCKMKQVNPVTYRVNSAKVDCEGVSPMSCFEIQKGDSIDSESWETFYAPIEGFEYEPGHLYLISVSETRLPKNEVPADASSTTYKLIEIIEKKQDPLLAIHDIYVVTEISGMAVTQKDNKAKAPTLEISVSKRLISGTDGCNSYSAAITELTENKISFGPVAATRMMCPDMTYPDAFTSVLSEVKAYSKSEGKVELLNAKGNVLIVLKKID